MPPRSDKSPSVGAAKSASKRIKPSVPPVKPRAGKGRPSFDVTVPSSAKPAAGWVYRSDPSDAAAVAAETHATPVAIVPREMAASRGRISAPQTRTAGPIERGVDAVTLPLTVGLLTVLAQWCWCFNVRKPR